MSKIIYEECLAFDDLALVAQHSSIDHRADVRTEGFMGVQPIILAGMFALDKKELGKAVIDQGGLVFLPRGIRKKTWGIPSFGMDIVDDYPPGTWVTIDTAFGHSTRAGQVVRQAKAYGYRVIAGTVDTAVGARYLVDVGADAVRVGIGPGRACSTRTVTGVGRGMATVIKEVGEAVSVPVICDGGIQKPADFVKALALGADACVIGHLFAQTKESGGGDYYGMASRRAMNMLNRTGTPEGINVPVKVTQTVEEVCEYLLGGLRSAMSYTGSRDLREFQKNTFLQRMSPAAQREGKLC